MYPTTLLEAKHMNLINKEDAIIILEKQNKYSDFDGIDVLNKLPSADVLPMSIISEIKSKVLEATWDSYYMPVKKLSADEIHEIIDKVIDDFKGIETSDNDLEHLEESGTPLWKIIEELGNKSYHYIECRCKWTDQDGDHDDFWGCCYYNNETKMLSSIDGDLYSLNDLYDEWKEWQTDNGEQCLTVWEYGTVEE